MLSSQKCGVASSDVGQKRSAMVLHSTLLVRGSERFQPSDEVGIVTPLSGAPDTFELRFCFPYSFAFGFQVNGKVFVRSIHADVPEPVNNGAEVDA